MIIGNGLLAQAFSEYNNNDEILIFASGVSNSLEEKESEFDREAKLLKSVITNNPDKTIVYFSTCSVYDTTVSHRPYIQHKHNMEGFIQDNCKQFFIFRLSNIVGEGGNKNTILNYLVNCVKNEEKINLWENATRNILDVSDVVGIVRLFIEGKESNRLLNIANLDGFKVLDIVRQIEVYLSKAADIDMINKGEPVEINISKTKSKIEQVLTKEKQSIDYIARLLKRYF